MSFVKGNVVMGEAPESDSEDELNVSDGVAVAPPLSVRTKGKVVAGEAPESDEETIGNSVSLDSISSAMSASSLTITVDQKKKQHKDGSLLNKKLIERNVSLVKNMKELTMNTIGSANSELNTTDRHILDCQLKVQEASETLRNLKDNILKLDEKLKSLLSSNYIPDIQIAQHSTS